MKVCEIISQDPQCIESEATVVQAADRMRAFDVGMLPVFEGDQMIGVVTDRDITVRATADGRDPNVAKVRDVMSLETTFCYDDQDIEEVAQLMEDRQVRRLPVVNRNMHLVGVVSLGDLAVRTGRGNLAGEVLEKVSEPNHLCA